jgi:hypothetical protein
MPRPTRITAVTYRISTTLTQRSNPRADDSQAAIDAHIETAKASQGQPGDDTPQAQHESGNGLLMAHGDQQDVNKLESHVRRAR